MKIKGLNNFKRKIEKRLVEEISHKNEPWVVVDGIHVEYVGDNKPLITIRFRAGYSFQDNHYQFDKIFELVADGNVEYLAGQFANEIEHCEAELI